MTSSFMINWNHGHNLSGIGDTHSANMAILSS
jgi:hypothetical protein